MELIRAVLIQLVTELYYEGALPQGRTDRMLELLEYTGPRPAREGFGAGPPDSIDT